MMSKSSSSTTSGGIGCTGLLVALLTTLFVGLKLTDNIDWSWWWVLSPLWIYAALAIVLFIVVVVVVLIVELTK
jgi:hypothetical protein